MNWNNILSWGIYIILKEGLCYEIDRQIGQYTHVRNDKLTVMGKSVHERNQHVFTELWCKNRKND